MNNNATLGWDLGGAHLKAVLVDGTGLALQVFQKPCPLWRGLDQLEQAVAAVLSTLKDLPLRHTVTMTGELADIFPSRDEGVARLAQCMTRYLGAAGMRVYAGPHGFVPATSVHDYLAAIASANWHASAAYLAARIGEGMFIDIGSTTSDLILLHQGRPAARGYTDAERLRTEEMVYTGVVRTPVMALAQRLPFGGDWQHVAAEHFATMADVYRLTAELPEDYDMADTADGAGKSIEESARRLSRMVGRDLADATMQQWRDLAYSVKSSQLRLLQKALERNLSRALLSDDAPLVGAGAGRFLVKELARAMRRPYQDASAWVSATPDAAEWAAVCLPAYAVACLGITDSTWQ